MRLLIQYLHLHRKSAVLLTVCALLFALVFFLYQLPVEAVHHRQAFLHPWDPARTPP